MSDFEPFYDIHGQLRRCGTWLPPVGFVSAMPKAFEEVFDVWDEVDIKRALADPNRRCGRKVFGPEWITNQQSKSSCNGYKAAAILSKARWLRGIQDGLILSGAYIYSKCNGGRDQGSMLDDALVIVEKYGAPPESLVPWDQIYPKLQPRNADEEAAKHKGLGGLPIRTKRGFDTAVARGMPVGCVVQAGRGYQTLNRDGIAGVDRGPGNHAVHVDDAKDLPDGRRVYDQAGSWGLGYGEQGRSWLLWDSFETPFESGHLFYAFPSTTEAGL